MSVTPNFGGLESSRTYLAFLGIVQDLVGVANCPEALFRSGLGYVRVPIWMRRQCSFLIRFTHCVYV
jgi:hypothetical protein